MGQVRTLWGLILLVGAVLLVLVSPASADAGPWGWPLAGSPGVARPYVPPLSAYGAGHRGVDLLGVPGRPVLAAGSGTVTYAGLLAGRGVVVVAHGSLRTTYEPVIASVSIGDAVGLGESLGTLGAGHLGCPVQACLHWGLRRGEDYLDPLRLVTRRPVRLLPLGPEQGQQAPVPQRAAPTALRGPAQQKVTTRENGPPVSIPQAALATGAVAAALVARRRR